MALTKTPIELSSTPSIVDGGNATAITISSAELVTVANGLTLTDGNVVVAAGHGIDFSANSSAAGMSSELFEHYEEGTWTPVMNALGTAGGTYAGSYTKTGRVVNWGAYILLPATSDESYIVVSGLPYASLGVQGTTSDTNIGYQNTSTRLQALINAGTALLYFYTDVASAAQPTYSGASGKTIYVGGSYITA